MAVMEDLQAAYEGYAAALAADALNPQPTYTLNGKNVQRNEWREGLMEAMAGLLKAMNARPYWVETRFRT